MYVCVCVCVYLARQRQKYIDTVYLRTVGWEHGVYTGKADALEQNA